MTKNEKENDNNWIINTHLLFNFSLFNSSPSFEISANLLLSSFISAFFVSYEFSSLIFAFSGLFCSSVFIFQFDKIGYN